MKNKKVLGALLALALALTPAAGCAKGGQAAENDGAIVLADFEQWAPDFQLMRPMNSFGVISVNEDPAYVKSGSRSAKLQPMGGYAKTTEPYVYFPLSSEYFGFNYGNFLNVEGVTMDLYNAQKENREVEIGLVTTVVDISTTDRFKGGVYSLKPGWNRVAYYPDLSVVNLSYDVTDIQGVYLGFENAGVRDTADAPVYYLDNVELKTAAEPIVIPDIIELEEGEICDFEKNYQQHIVSIDSPNVKCIPDMSIVRAADEGITAPHGEKVLKVVTKPGDSAEASWPRFIIPEKIVRRSGYMDIPKEEWGDYRFCFEVYAATKSKTFFPEFYSQGGGNWSATNVSARLGAWTTYSKDFTAPEFKSEDIIANPGFIKIAWAEYVDGGEMTFYFDNFRFEKKDK